MRKILLILILLSGQSILRAQLLSTSPQFISEGSTPVEITVDAVKGNQGLKDYSGTGDVYVHLGVITNFSANQTDWKYSKFTWATTNALANCQSLGNNQWKYTINGGLRSFFGITNAGERILKIAILFRSGNGALVQRNADGSDMYIPVYDNTLQVRIDDPRSQPTFVPVPEPNSKTVGDPLPILVRSNTNADLSITFNGNNIITQSNAVSVSATPVITSAGWQSIGAVAVSGGQVVRDTFSFFVGGGVNIAPLPPGVKDGINYEPGDTSATLVLYAPGKNSVTVVGDFSNWAQGLNYQMNRTPDGNRFWIRLTGLTPTVEYAYQFIVDGSLRVADYMAEKILDPANDPFISPATYPSLKPYPSGKTTGIVSVLQTRKPGYNWQAGSFARPDKRNIVVYELLLRDFLQQSNWKTLKDTLTYIKRLGVNVIELMPFSEFEGNNSWGYNPSFFFAPDKYYGTENDLRAFIDECHRQGIAVVMDMVMNHAFGQSPMVQLYFDNAVGKPANNSPWFNVDATHPFSVGYDFNHEAQATKNMVDLVVEHWLTKYRLDGFRWDLSKGFTQTSNPTNTAAWSAYDASRVAIWKRIYDKMQSVSAGSYCILEHFADNTEEKELADYGMLLWGNGNYNVNEATMGFVSTSNFDGLLFTKKAWTKPHLVGYQESHDEERLMYKNITFGNNSNASHNTRDLATAMKRNAMATAFWAMMPGPKMLWQFGELGYDYSITWCPSTSSVPAPYPSSQCRTDAKPPRWDYQQDASRKGLYEVYAALNKLRLTPNFNATFVTSNINYDLSGAFKWMTVQSDSLKLMVIGNFDVVGRTGNITFPAAGPWYSYLVPGVRNATGGAESITLQPGEYYVYTDRDVNNQGPTSVSDLRPDFSDQSLIIYPNPVTRNSVLAYEIPLTGPVKISIWNMQGQQMGEWNAGLQVKGKHQVSLDQASLRIPTARSGNYILVLDVNGKRMKKQFMISR